MKFSFRYRFILSFLSIELFFISLIVFFNFSSLTKLSYALIDEKIHASTILFSEMVKTPMAIYDLGTLDDQVKSFVNLKNVVAVKVYDKEEKLLSSATADSKFDLETFSSSLNDVEIQGRSFRFKSIPILIHGENIGKVKILFELTESLKSIEDNRQMTFLLILLEISLSSLVAYVIGSRLTNALSRLTQSAELIAQDDQIIIPDVGRNGDEMSILSDALHIMQQRILQRNKNLYEMILKYQNSSSQLQLLLDSMSEGAYGVDLNGTCTFINKSFLRILGYESAEEVLGNNIHSLIHHSHLDGSSYSFEDCNIHSVIVNKLPTHIDNEVFWCKDGSAIAVEYWSNPMMLEGELAGAMVTFIDITLRKQSEKRLHYMANFDPLTGLPNRVQLDDHLKYILGLMKRTNGNFALMFLDLDHFKGINDTLGHSVGDGLLIQLAQRLKSQLREEDMVSRLGGDEFILLLPGIDTQGASQVAHKLLEMISKIFLVDQHELTVTASIGIAMYPLDGTEIETLSKNADTAMYRAKHEGRNAYCFFTEEMQVILTRHQQLSNALHNALARKELHVVYQPQISIESGNIIGCEALLRWEHPTFGIVSPSEFIPIAEENGSILAIGEWVLKTAMKQTKLWMERGYLPMIVAVNISAVQFRYLGLPTLVENILQETGLPPEYLELELTEAVAMYDPQAAIGVMNELHERGIRMSIDDFGTGYSSLSYLKKFKVYKLKIDQSFVRDISTDSEDKAIVSAVINMAHSLGLHTIAEGVETLGQLEYLREQGCDEVQGYYFSKPLLPNDFEDFWRKCL